jgi:hypothetical protein
MLGIAAISLDVKESSASEFAQPMSEFSSMGKPRVSFRYPTPYWSVEELEGYPAGVTAVNVSLRVKGETLEEGRTYASIYVEAVEKSTETSTDQIFKNLKGIFAKSGFEFNRKTLAADIEPRLSAPLGKIERWDVTIEGLRAEVALLLLPQGKTYLSFGLFTMKREDNLFGWMTAWRTFEILVGDLTRKTRSFYAIRKSVMPSNKELGRVMAETLADFAVAVNTKDFSVFHTKLAQHLQSQTTPEKLYGSFRSFADKGLDPKFYRESSPKLSTTPYVQIDGVLKLEGFYLTQPLRTHFRLKYLYQNSAWKLLGIHISLKEEPI